MKSALGALPIGHKETVHMLIMLFRDYTQVYTKTIQHFIDWRSQSIKQHILK